MHAATLRQRAKKLERATERLDPTPQQDNSSSPSDLRRPPRPPPPLARAHRQTARVRLILSSLAILGVLIYAAKTGRLSASSSRRARSYALPGGAVDGEWRVGSLPTAYAVCVGASGGLYTAAEGEADDRLSRGEGDRQVPLQTPSAERSCLVVNGQQVVSVGPLSAVQAAYGDADSLGPPPIHSHSSPARAFDPPKAGLKIIHLPAAASLTPGFVDAHGHLQMYGAWATSVDLVGSRSMADVVRRLKEAVENDPALRDAKEGRWIEGVGWDQNGWESGAFPTWEALDAEPLLQGRKIILTRIDSHSILVSRAVLALLPSPLPTSIEGGAIVRSPTTGEPTGLFLDNAMNLVFAVRGRPAEDELNRRLARVARDAVSKGLVGVHDAGTSPQEVAFYTARAKANALPLRIYSMLACPDRSLFCGTNNSLVPSGQIPWEAYDGSFVLRSVKLVADGALGSEGAAMHEPYAGREAEGWRGLLLADEAWFKPLVREWVEHGWQVNVHAIGDRANTVVLDAFAPHLSSSAATADGNPHRLRIEHAQLLTPADLDRVVDLGVIASYQPTHATSDMGYVLAKLGPARMARKGNYAWRSVLDGGGRVALGSDFPIESVDPLKGFYAAVTRLDERGDSPHGPGGWYPAERLTRQQALKGMTLDPAYAAFAEEHTGSLEPGKRADFVVWDRDIMACPPAEILEAKVLVTVINGQPVWGSI